MDICDTGLGVVLVEYTKGPVVVTGDDEFAASILADLVHHRPYRVGGDVLFRGKQIKRTVMELSSSSVDLKLEERNSDIRSALL